MTLELYWYAITETIRYYFLQFHYLFTYYYPYFVPCILSLVAICAGYTYIINLRRAPDDPLKRKYYLSGIVFAPITFIFFISLGVLVFLLRALVFTFFLILVTVLLATRRKPLLLVWWDRFALKIGEPLLKINARLIRMAFGR